MVIPDANRDCVGIVLADKEEKVKNKLKLVTCLISVFVLFFYCRLLAEDFSADVTSTTKAGTFNGKIYASKDKFRMDTPESTTITRLDKQTMWILIPAQKSYMEQPVDANSVITSAEKIAGEIDRMLVAEEVIRGKKANKYKITYNLGKGDESIYQWLIPGSNIPVKTAAVDGSWSMEYNNIVAAVQPDSLFELPSGYQKLSYSMPSLQDLIKQEGEAASGGQ